MKLTSIQMLRGIAAFAVMMSHLYAMEVNAIDVKGAAEASLIGPVWEKGFAGVDLFFVISGFIMVYVTAGRERGAASAADFAIARASRIYPLWWLFMSVTAIYFLSVHGVPGDPIQFQLAGQSEAVYLLNSALLLPQAGHPALGIGWTLIHEMYFYVVFAAFLFAPQKWLPFLLAGWAAFVVACDLAGYSNYYPTNLFELANYPMTVEFIAGAFAALLVMSGRRAFALPLTFIGAGAFIVSMFVFSNADAEYTLRWGRVLWFGLPAVILIYGITSLEAEGGLKLAVWPPRLQRWAEWIWRRLVRLGDISFALYLGHILAISGLKRLFEFIGGELRAAGAPSFLADMFVLGTPGPLDNFVFLVTSVIAAIVLAELTYRYFERPSLSVLSKWRRGIVRPISSPDAAKSFAKPCGKRLRRHHERTERF